MNALDSLFSQFTSGIVTILITAASAALVAYFRREVYATVEWLFNPMARFLPWHRVSPVTRPELPNLVSERTVVNIFLTTADGRSATYEKTTDYLVETGAITGHDEGITASGSTGNFSIELGVIVDIRSEHGFCVFQIDLGRMLGESTRFRNVFRVDLTDCFVHEEEHWSQEIALPTQYLALRIHFPIARPPRLIRCKRVVGLTAIQMITDAAITELSGHIAILWNIEHPKVGDIYKLEWLW